MMVLRRGDGGTVDSRTNLDSQMSDIVPKCLDPELRTNDGRSYAVH